MDFGARNLIRIFICCMVGMILVSGGWSANASDKHRMGMTVEEAAAALESGVSEIRLPVSEQEMMLREIFGRYPALGYAYDGIEGTVRTGVACLRVSLREIGSERVAVIAEQDAFMRLVLEAMLRAEPSVHLVIRRTDANAWDYEKMLCEIERNEVLGRSYLSHHAWRKWKQPYTDDVYVQIQFGYTEPRTDIIEKKKLAEASAAALANSIFMQEMNVWERILLAHDALRYRCVYDESAEVSADQHTVYGALCEGRAVCEGYAEAFALLMEMGGISCQVVSGETKSGLPHAWNLVQAEGKWYHVDVTWDDSEGSDAYPYFLRNDRAFGESHCWNRSEYPSAEGETVNAEGIRNGLRKHGLEYVGFETAAYRARVEAACRSGEIWKPEVSADVPPVPDLSENAPCRPLSIAFSGKMLAGLAAVGFFRLMRLRKKYEILQKGGCYLRKKRV